MSFLLLFCHDQFADEGTVFVAAAAAAELRCNSHKMSLFHLRRPPDDRSFNNFVPPLITLQKVTLTQNSKTV